MGINTDHSLVKMTLLNPWQPHMGEGRYAMPALIIKERALMDAIKDLGIEHQLELKKTVERRTMDYNPQTLHKRFKEKIIGEIRNYSKRTKPKVMKEIHALKADRLRTLNNRNMDEASRAEEAAIIGERIQKLEAARFMRARDTTNTNYFLNGETISKSWICMNKDRTTRDVIVALKKPPPEGT